MDFKFGKIKFGKIKFGKIIRKIVACFILACGFTLILAGCDYTTYPSDFNARWESMEPEFVLEYRQPTNEHPYTATEYIVLNGERQFIQVSYSPTHDFFVLLAGTTSMDAVLLRGSWELSKNQNKLVLYIHEDNLFDGTYAEICFTRKELE